MRVFLQAIAFSPDGEKLAVSGTTPGTAGSRVRFWDITPNGGEPRLLWEIEAPAEGNRAPSGSSWLGSNGTPCRLFRTTPHVGHESLPKDDSPLGSQRPASNAFSSAGHTESTCCVAFSPRRPDLPASSGHDDTVRLWDMGTGEELRLILTGHRGKANSLVFSADGKTLVSTGDDTTMLFYDVAEVTQRPPSKATPLSADECESLWADLASRLTPPRRIERSRRSARPRSKPLSSWASAYDRPAPCPQRRGENDGSPLSTATISRNGRKETQN